MKVKTEDLLSEITEALYQKKAVLLTGSTGVGKPTLPKEFQNSYLKVNTVAFQRVKLNA